MVMMRAAVVAMVLVAGMGVGRAWADDDDAKPGTAAKAPEAAPDKSGYWLFKPVPKDLMRDMDTDRPDKTNGPYTIDAGHLQLEMGLADYAYARERSGKSDVRTDTWGLGEADLRIGVFSNVELDVGTTAFTMVSTHDVLAGTTDHAQGMGDTPVGFKMNFWGNDAGDAPWTTAFGMQALVKIPTAPGSIGNRHGEGSLGFPLAVALPADFHLTIEPLAVWERNRDNTASKGAFENGVVVDHTIFFEKLDAYVEYWTHLARGEKGQGTVDWGLVLQVAPNVTVDTGFAFGVNDASPRVEWTVGASIRF
jgi:hypothetical protein